MIVALSSRGVPAAQLPSAAQMPAPFFYEWYPPVFLIRIVALSLRILKEISRSDGIRDLKESRA